MGQPYKDSSQASLFLHTKQSSVGKESSCDAGDPGLILWLGRSTGERIGYPLQYSWASLVAQLIKNPPMMWETWVQSQGWEEPLEKRKATHSSILAWRIPWLYSPWGHKQSDTTERLSLTKQRKQTSVISVRLKPWLECKQRKEIYQRLIQAINKGT